MIESRRNFLRSLGIGAAAGAAVGWPFRRASATYAVDTDMALQSGGLIRLDSNENAYGPSPRVTNALRSSHAMVNRYPFLKHDEVLEQIASFHQVKQEQVLLGCGSTEMLRVAACAFLGNGRQLIQASPTFEAIEHYAKAVGSEVVSVGLNHGFAHDLDYMLARVGTSTGLVYICNPNNPTASITPRQDLERFIAKLPATVRVLIDEAYHHYVPKSGMYSSFIDRPVNDKRVIVTRTFSKAYGLAGLRLGYAIASPKVVEEMRKFLTEAGLNAIVAEVAGLVLGDTEGLIKLVKRNSDDRQEFFNSAMVRRLKPISSSANFVMMNTEHPAQELIGHFRKHNVLIGRQFPPMNDYIRVSLGTPDEMRAFWRVWDMLPWSKQLMQH